MEIKSKKKNPAGAEQMQEHDLAGRAAAISFNGENVGQAAAERCRSLTCTKFLCTDCRYFSTSMQTCPWLSITIVFKIHALTCEAVSVAG